MEANALSPRTDLNAQQLQLVELIADPTDHRTYAEKFEAVGYSEDHGYKLTRDPKFIEAACARARELVGGELPKIYRELAKDASDQGLDPEDRHRAANIVLRATGEIASGGVTINDNRGAVFVVGELPAALQAHDAERRALMREVMSVDHAQVADQKPRKGRKGNGHSNGNGNGSA